MSNHRRALRALAPALLLALAACSDKAQVANTTQDVLDADIKAELSQLHTTVLNDLRRNFQMHLDSLAARTNLFGLNTRFWAEFVGSERWTMYCFVIKRYQMKY